MGIGHPFHIALRILSPAILLIQNLVQISFMKVSFISANAHVYFFVISEKLLHEDMQEY